MSKEKNIKKIMELDMEAGHPPSIENLSEIFEAALLNQSIKVDDLRNYMHEVKPTLKEISQSLQLLAEENHEEVSSKTARAIEEGLQLMSLADGRMREEDNQEIYNRMADFMASELPAKKSFEELILYLLLILGGSLLTAAIIPYLMEEHEKYFQRANKLVNWLTELLHHKNETIKK